jgi:GT2 family glycosyltransferase
MEISVVIPTRNRPELLKRLLIALQNQNLRANQIIVVDSSDELLRLPQDEREIPRVTTFVYTDIRSAAIQRNIGIEHVSRNCEYLFFLDDDVLPQPDYFEKMTSSLSKNDVIGVSGLAINPKATRARLKPLGLAGFIQRIFLLDSKHDGKLLMSGVNIPLRHGAKLPQEVDWLIGCAGWQFSEIRDLRFEIDFYGQSLAEDVIFSAQASKRGTLITDPSVVLSHDESEIGRASNQDHWEMWMMNRWRLIKVQHFGLPGIAAFWWSSLGQFAIFLLSRLIKGDNYLTSARGILYGARSVMRTKN